MTDKRKQCRELLAHLERHRTITPMEAYERLGIYRLAARVFDLRAAGHGIKTLQRQPHAIYGLETRYEH